MTNPLSSDYVAMSLNYWFHIRRERAVNGCMGIPDYSIFSAFVDPSSLKRHRTSTAPLRDIVDCVLNHPQPWKWHGKEYLGAVHGTIGIITQIVLSFHSQQVLDKLSPILANLLRTQYTSGNFSSSSTSSHNDVLVQFCHGAPGFLVSLRSLLPYFPDLRPEITSAIQKAEQCVLERGVLTKFPCLCHGVYGNALSLPSHDMLKFLKLTCQGGMKWDDEEDPDEGFGLFTGEGGRSWAMAIAAKQKEATVLGFNDL